MDNELYDIAHSLKGFGRDGWKIVKAEKVGNQWSLVIEKETVEKVADDDNNK